MNPILKNKDIIITSSLYVRIVVVLYTPLTSILYKEGNMKKDIIKKIWPQIASLIISIMILLFVIINNFL